MHDRHNKLRYNVLVTPWELSTTYCYGCICNLSLFQHERCSHTDQKKGVFLRLSLLLLYSHDSQSSPMNQKKHEPVNTQNYSSVQHKVSALDTPWPQSLASKLSNNHSGWSPCSCLCPSVSAILSRWKNLFTIDEPCVMEQKQGDRNSEG